MDEPIKDYYGKIIGWIETKPNGDKLAKDYYRRLIGTYEKRYNVTKDYYGRIIGQGDATSSLVWTEHQKYLNK